LMQAMSVQQQQNNQIQYEEQTEGHNASSKN